MLGNINPYTIRGDFGAANFSTVQDNAGNVRSRYLTINTEGNLNFYKRFTLLKGNLTDNSLGLFSYQKANKRKKVKFASLYPPKHIFRPRKGGCAFVSKGKIKMGVEDFSICAIETEMKHCPDETLGTCLRSIYGSHNRVRDVFATPEGAALWGELTNLVYIGQANSLWDIIWFGRHPLIDAADENDWYKGNIDDEDEWEDLVENLDSCGGIITAADTFKAMGYENMNVQIRDADISADRQRYIGWTPDLFDRLLDAQSTDMKRIAKHNLMMGGFSMKSIILVDPSIFHKYEQDMMTKFDTLPQTMHYFMNREFCKAIGCLGGQMVPGVLSYNGHWVVCKDVFADLDKYTGTKTFRAMAVTPGLFGIGYDADSLDGETGMGMRITQQLDAPFKGQVYMDNTFEIGTGIINPEFMTMASKTFTPPVNP